MKRHAAGAPSGACRMPWLSAHRFPSRRGSRLSLRGAQVRVPLEFTHQPFDERARGDSCRRCGWSSDTGVDKGGHGASTSTSLPAARSEATCQRRTWISPGRAAWWRHSQQGRATRTQPFSEVTDDRFRPVKIMCYESACAQRALRVGSLLISSKQALASDRYGATRRRLNVPIRKQRTCRTTPRSWPRSRRVRAPFPCTCTLQHDP